MIEKILLGIWDFIQNKMWWVLLIAILLLIPAGIGASKVGLSNQYSDYIDPSSQTYKNLKLLDGKFTNDNILVLMEGDSLSQLLSKENLDAMKVFDEHFSKDPRVMFVMTPEYLITLQKTMMSDPNKTKDIDYAVDPKTGEIIPVVKDVVLAEQDDVKGTQAAVMLVVSINGGQSDDAKHSIINDMKKEVKTAGFEEGVTLKVTGFPVILDWEIQETSNQVTRVTAIAAVLMLLLLALFFRVRGFFLWRWLVMGLVGIGVFYTMGLMGLMDMNITPVAMGVFPILIGLGVDYSVQFHNRYDEESRKGQSAEVSAKNTFMHIGAPLTIAMLTGCAGFASVFFARTPMVKDFGTTLIIGVLVCLVVSVTLLVGILYLRDKKREIKAEPRKADFMQKVAEFIAPRAVKFAAIILIIAIGLSAFGWSQEHTLKGNVGFDAYMNSDASEMVVLNKVVGLTGGVYPGDMFVTADNVLDPKVLQWMIGVPAKR
ncbi:MAG: MMPL family transporter [Dehalococcoidia bacterium]|nr:MMPL family transporter [Dehalococcoidia bacterium]